MKFTVAWSEEASNELCELWAVVPDRREMTRVVDALEQQLRHNPESVGESREKGRRVVMQSPIGIIFKVFPEDQLVQVVHVGWFPSHR